MYGWDDAELIIRTGIATPWRHVPIAEIPGGDNYVYLCDGHQSGNAGLLAEALRADGVFASFYPAVQAAESAHLTRSFYGYLDDDDENEIFCAPDGSTPMGDQVDEARQCVIAWVLGRGE